MIKYELQKLSAELLRETRGAPGPRQVPSVEVNVWILQIFTISFFYNSFRSGIQEMVAISVLNLIVQSKYRI